MSTAASHSQPPTVPIEAARSQRLAAAAGIAAGPLFLSAVALLTWLRYDYLRSLGWSIMEENDVPWPSGLALGGSGWAQMLNFALSGLLLLVFILALRHELPHRRSSRVASTLMTVMAVAMVASAAPTDRDFSASPSTWHGWTHGISFIVIVLLSVLTPLLTARALRGDPRWRPMAAVSLVVALTCALSLFVPSQVGFYLFLTTLFGWFTALAVRFSRLTAPDQSTTPSG
jgi:chromate transport protein ChrA